MTEKFKQSIEQWKIPISIMKFIGVIAVVITFTWVAATEYDKLNTKALKNEAHCLKLESEITALKTNANASQIKLAEIQKDVQYIRLMLEKGIGK